MISVDALVKHLGISKEEAKSFLDLIKSLDWIYVESIFEEGFSIGAFKRDKNRNVLRWEWNNKTYEISRYET